MMAAKEKIVRYWATDGPDNPTHFWCQLCDEILPLSKFSHICSYIGGYACKTCNKELLKNPRKRKAA